MSLIFTPHDYQHVFLGDYLKWVDNDANPGDCRLYTSPTGTGKSVMELMALDADPYALLVTPRLEIVAGMLTKLGTPGVDTWGTEKLAIHALARRITTPVRLRNMLAAGTLYDRYAKACEAAGVEWQPLTVHRIIFDEGHHLLADTYADIRAYLPAAQIVCLTATGYRGTPKETEKFHAIFGGQVNQILSLRQAAERGLFSVPQPELWPLIDDDTLEVVNGEIRVDSASEAVRDAAADVVGRCRGFVGWDRPTMFAVPSVTVAHYLTNQLNDADLPAAYVTQDTPRAERNEIFRRTVAREIALVQIDVVSEGVDLPIRRLIDLRPTLSPVKWMQQLGRITRPFECHMCIGVAFGYRNACPNCHGTGRGTAEYICTNRNLERHGYLLEGLLPPPVMAYAQLVFGRPTKRAGLRVVGLEGLGKFQGVELPLLGGLTGLMYNITTLSGYRRKDIVAILHPCSPEPIIAERESTRNPADDTYSYGTFRQIDKLPDLNGYASASPKQLSPRQKSWWVKEASRFGLSPLAEVNRKNFGALPVLKDLNIALKGG